MFTTDESDTLEDIKIEIRRTYDLRTTKNEIVRIAVRDLIEDYRKRGEGSTIISVLTKKR